MPDPECPFCHLRHVLFETRFFNLVHDNFPVNPGHLLVVLKRHESSALHLIREEWEDLHTAISWATDTLAESHGAHSFNIGVNIGADAGQTIGHVHVHIIPRYPGDCAAPRGGVRLVKRLLVDY